MKTGRSDFLRDTRIYQLNQRQRESPAVSLAAQFHVIVLNPGQEYVFTQILRPDIALFSLLLLASSWLLAPLDVFLPFV